MVIDLESGKFKGMGMGVSQRGVEERNHGEKGVGEKKVREII